MSYGFVGLFDQILGSLIISLNEEVVCASAHKDMLQL